MKTKTETKLNETFTSLKDAFSWKNTMQASKIEKIIVSTGIGRVRKDGQRVELIQDRLAKITGQKPSPRKARQSIASFKLREGEVIGFAATLRGKRMLYFFDRLIHVAIPRMRDFRGISRTSVDEMGNLTIGIKEHTIFPETPDENLQDVFSLAVTVVTSASNHDEAIAFFEHLGVPFTNEKNDSN
ncbi:MAG: 50S ribosomal protein L5 [Candidatus Kaiserbacteria bacterium]|nr:50S ribosomal protein L5 [Candidatus Kaiserbacteria bacterium]